MDRKRKAQAVLTLGSGALKAAKLGLRTAGNIRSALRTQRKRKTKTGSKTKKRSKLGKASKEWDGCLKTIVRYKGRKMPAFAKRLTMNGGLNRSAHSTNSAGNHSCIIGKQKNYLVADYNTRSEINNEYSAVDGHGIWKGFKARNMFTNQSNAQIFITAYFCKCVKATDLGALATWEDIATLNGVTSMPEVFFRKPTDFKEFGKFWRVEREESVCLAPGMVWNLFINHFPNYSVKPAVLSNTYNTEYLPGVSCSAFLTIHGPPINDTINASSEITLGFTQKLDYVLSKTVYRYKYVPNGVTYAATDNLLKAFTNAPSIMAEDTDTKVVGLNA